MQRSKMRLHDVRQNFCQVAYLMLRRNYVQTVGILNGADEPTGSGESAQGGTWTANIEMLSCALLSAYLSSD